MTAHETRPQTLTPTPHPRLRHRTAGLIGLIVLVATCWGVLLTVLPAPSGVMALAALPGSDLPGPGPPGVAAPDAQPPSLEGAP